MSFKRYKADVYPPAMRSGPDPPGRRSRDSILLGVFNVGEEKLSRAPACDHRVRLFRGVRRYVHLLPG